MNEQHPAMQLESRSEGSSGMETITYDEHSEGQS